MPSSAQGAGRPICPCETDVEEPGPHIESCPFRDPDYCPPGWPPDPEAIRATLLATLFDLAFDDMLDARDDEDEP